MLPIVAMLIMSGFTCVQCCRLMTGDLSFAREHFDDLVPNALGAPDTPWPLDPSNGLINTSNVLIDWPSGMQDRYELSNHNSVANAFGYCEDIYYSRKNLQLYVATSMFLGE